MTSPVPLPPEILFAAAAREAAGPETSACIDCAIEGVPATLGTVYTVSGTVLCVEHAVLARTAQTAGAAK
jgi:hypothetical protein